MSVYKRYFRVTNGPMVEEIDRLFELRFAASARYKEFGDKYGATETHSFERSGAFAGFVFNTPPDQAVYRRDAKTRLWLPRKNVPAGKAIWAEINELPKAHTVEYAPRLAGLEPGMPFLTDAGRWYAPSLWGFGAPRNVWFVSVPWMDVDPDKLAAYKADKAEGKRFDRDLDALSWEPPAGWTEVKRWQVEKESDEIQAAIAAEKGTAADDGDFE